MDKKQESRKAQVPEFTASLFAWPALMAASMGEAFAASLARRPAEHESPPERRPFWTTRHCVHFELGTMALRDFSCGEGGTPTLICAPFALHTATIADFAPGRSVVEALRGGGIERLFVTDWRSAGTWPRARRRHSNSFAQWRRSGLRPSLPISRLRRKPSIRYSPTSWTGTTRLRSGQRMNR